MKPPSKIEVGPHTYKVVVGRPEIDRQSVEQESALLGNVSRRKLIITLNPDLSPSVLAETLAHEVLHVLFGGVGLSEEWGEEKEEAVVNRLSPLVLDTLRRNPRLVSYLMEK